MRTTFLTAAFVIASFITNSQTFNNPTVVNSILDHTEYEWFVTEDNKTTRMLMGSNEIMDNYSREILKYIGLDPEFPNRVKDNTKVWNVINNDGKSLFRVFVVRNHTITTIMVEEVLK